MQGIQPVNRYGTGAHGTKQNVLEILSCHRHQLQHGGIVLDPHLQRYNTAVILGGQRHIHRAATTGRRTAHHKGGRLFIQHGGLHRHRKGVGIAAVGNGNRLITGHRLVVTIHRKTIRQLHHRIVAVGQPQGQTGSIQRLAIGIHTLQRQGGDRHVHQFRFSGVHRHHAGIAVRFLIIGNGGSNGHRTGRHRTDQAVLYRSNACIGAGPLNGATAGIGGGHQCKLLAHRHGALGIGQGYHRRQHYNRIGNRERLIGHRDCLLSHRSGVVTAYREAGCHH